MLWREVEIEKVYISYVLRRRIQLKRHALSSLLSLHFSCNDYLTRQQVSLASFFQANELFHRSVQEQFSNELPSHMWP